MSDQQHDDHIWLTVRGEGWAIRRIERYGAWRFHLWRGYEPHLEYAIIEMTNWDIEGYAETAASWLKAGHA